MKTWLISYSLHSIWKKKNFASCEYITEYKTYSRINIYCISDTWADVFPNTCTSICEIFNNGSLTTRIKQTHLAFGNNRKTTPELHVKCLVHSLYSCKAGAEIYRSFVLGVLAFGCNTCILTFAHLTLLPVIKSLNFYGKGSIYLRFLRVTFKALCVLLLTCIPKTTTNHRIPEDMFHLIRYKFGALLFVQGS